MKTQRINDAIKRVGELPALPAVLGQALEAASDPEASALDLGRFIAADQSLAAAVLKLVNSAYYGFYREITSVPRAIVLLGFQEVRKLVLATTAFQTLSGGDSGFDRVQLWRHSLATAITAERCAKTLDIGVAADCFTTGLLHDVGKVVFELLYTEPYQRAAARARVSGRFVREAELEVFEMDHAEIGARLAEHWNMPPTVVETIRFHHEPASSTEAAALTCVTALADFITYRAGLGETSNGREPEYPAAVVRRLSVNEDQVDDLISHLARTRDTVNELLGVLNG